MESEAKPSPDAAEGNRGESFAEVSYQLHERSDLTSHKSMDLDLYRSWFESGTVDLWRQLRMLGHIDPLLKEYPGAKWLAVGDGSYGTASTYIGRQGGVALPVDINTSLLEIAKRNGMIQDFKKENAESLSFGPDSFDFALCKDAYHHFPRPMIGLYEMLRCSRKAVVLIEPADWVPSPLPRRCLQSMKSIFRRILRIRTTHHDTGNFESAGNYVYNVSEREIEKVALGLHLPAVAFRRFHDVYVEGVEYERADQNSRLFSVIKRKLMWHNLGCRLGLSRENHIAAIIFKESPTVGLRTKLTESGFTVIDLPKNPYLTPLAETDVNGAG